MIVTWETSDCFTKANALALQLGLKLASSANHVQNHGYSLHVTPARLEIRSYQNAKTVQLFVDLVNGSLGYRLRKGEGKRQAIARAVGMHCYPKPLRVFDVTAGLGSDAFVLASLGCQLHLVERSPIVAALLQDGLHRAISNPQIGAWAKHVLLSVMDSQKLLSELSLEDCPEVIYLDPMFPARTKSALVKKNMQILQELVGEDDNVSLLALALEKATKRVVVKRPKGAPHLQNKSPNFSLVGKSCRFDIYLKN
jgi:16S rRNA (guanine1516-N2)-methyltransferase